jgi:indole-3-glycerol phosphate synthase
LVVGVNNRDLCSFVTDLAVAERLSGRLANVAVRVAESGVRTAADAARMSAAGYDAVLVGEALVRSKDPARLIRAFRDHP